MPERTSEPPSSAGIPENPAARWLEQRQESAMSKLDGTFWYCMTHRRVEPYHGCKNADRIGPFQTEAEAAHALQTIAEREEQYEMEDSEWNGDG
jgi:hypothetical protein